MMALVLALLALAPGGSPAAPAARPAPAVAARPGDTAGRALLSDKPVTVNAEEVRFNWKTRQVLVVGKPFVSMVQDDATLTCRRLTGDNDAAGKLARAVCTGDVKLVRGDRTVTCERAVYERDLARITCTGHPELKDANGTVAHGVTLVYDLAADEVRLETADVLIPSGQVDLATQRGVTRTAP